MENIQDAKLLRIFLGESDTIGHKSFYETIVFKAREMGFSGATVLRGMMGYGAHSVVHHVKFFEISSDLPIVVEIVESEEKIREFVKVIEELFEKADCGGLITIEKAEVIRYRAGSKRK